MKILKGKQNSTTENSKELNIFNDSNRINSKDSNLDFVEDYLKKPVLDNLNDNINYIRTTLGNTFDLIIRTIIFESDFQKIEIGIVYIIGLADPNFVNETILKTISRNFRDIKRDLKNKDEILDYFTNTLLTLSSVTIIETFGKLFNSMHNGNTVILLPNTNVGIEIDSKGLKERPVQQPVNEITIKGGKDSFNENFLTTVALIRTRIKHPNLRIDKYVMGKKSNTSICIMYIKGVADDKLVTEVKTRLHKIKPEMLIDISFMEHYIAEKQFSLFPVMYSTERPDVVSSNLFEGRIALISDGSPSVYIVPNLLVQHIHSDEDFYQKAVISVFFRLIRYMSLFIGLYLPAIYVSLVYFHSELLPITFLLNIAGQRQDVPFPVFVEIMLITLGFDLLRESGSRMPKSLGSPLSFLGAIIIGQSAVEAGLVTPIIVIIVTITGLSTFAIPSYDLNLTITVLRYINIFAAILGGLFGLTIAFIILMTHLVSLRSFGVSYLSPYSPLSIPGMRDSLYRSTITKIFKRKQNISDRYPY